MSVQNLQIDPLLRELSSSKDPQKHAIAVLMMEDGADVNGFDAEGNTLLHVAVKSEAFVVIEAIIKRKKRIIFEVEKSSIALAMRSSYAVELLTLLFNHCRNFDFGECCKLLPWDMSEDHLIEVLRTLLQLTKQTKESDIANCILRFVEKNRRLAKLLITCTTRTGNKMANLQNLLSYDLIVRSPITIAFLISEGAKINDPVNKENQYALHLACQRWIQPTAWLLLHVGADVNVTDQSGNTPFAMSFRGQWEFVFDHGYTSMTKYMIEHFVSLNVAGKKVNEQDLLVIGENPKLQSYYDSCMKEMERMKTIEAADGFPYYWFFSKSNYQLASLLGDTNVFKQIRKNLLRLEPEVFPTYKDEVIVKFGFANNFSELVVREQVLEEVFGEIFPWFVIRKIVQYSFDMKNFEKNHYLNRYL